jgi:hypothetical protein
MLLRGLSTLTTEQCIVSTVEDIHQIYADWTAKGAEFLTEPKDHGREIRAYVRDPDGHLIEVGQSIR